MVVAVCVAAVVCAAAVECAVAEAEVNIMNKEKAIVNSTNSNLLWQRLLAAVVTTALLLTLVLIFVSRAGAQTTPLATGKAFATPQDAANSLIEAAEKYDEAALTEVLGTDSYDIIHTGEPARDSEKCKEFAAHARAKMSVEVDKTKTRATMVVGEEDWPFPVPIVKAGKSWFFDTKAGRREILLRRIGQNELDAIEICRGYVEAQHAYALKKREGYNVNQYAQRIISTEGKQDGLAWKKADGTWDGPIGEKVAAAIAQRLHQPHRTVSRLLLQSSERSGSGRAAGPARLRHQGCDDWRIRPGRFAGTVPEHRSQVLHREPGRRRL